MMQDCGAEKLQSVELRKELESCAYTVFAAKGISDRGKPDFLKTNQELRTDFKEYVLANQRAICDEIQSIDNAIDILFITYSLLDVLGQYLPKGYREILEKEMLYCYVDNLAMLQSISESGAESNTFFHECVALMLPAVLPIVLNEVVAVKQTILGGSDIRQAMTHKYLEDISLFDKITTADKLVGVFFSEYKDLKITNLEDYLSWLYQCYYFLYVLLHQDSAMLKVADIEKIVACIKDKRVTLTYRRLFSGECLYKMQALLKILLEIDAHILPESTAVYKETKPVLFSLVLEILLPTAQPKFMTTAQHEIFAGCLRAISTSAFGNIKLPERDRIEIYMALFALAGVDIEDSVDHLKYFSVDALIEIVTRIRLEVLQVSSYLECAKYVSLIVKQSIIANKSYAAKEGTVFFEKTQDDFAHIFKGTVAKMVALFYFEPDHCYKSIGTLKHEGEIKPSTIVSEVMKHHKFHLVTVMYNDYKNLFPEAKKLLVEFHSLSLDAMDKAKAWDNKRTCALLVGVTTLLVSAGIKNREVDFITVSRGLKALIQKGSASDKIVLSADDLVFWSYIFEVFYSLKDSTEAWGADHQQEIDKLFLTVLNNMSLGEADSSAIFEARLCAIMLNIASKEARLEIYKHIGDLFLIINTQHEFVFIDEIHWFSLVRAWLVEGVDKADKKANSGVLSQLHISSQKELPLMNRALYLYQLAEVLHLITQKSDCFYLAEDMYSKIAEISGFILEERDIIYSLMKVAQPMPFDSVSAVLLCKGQNFLDQDFMELLKSKVYDARLEPGSIKASSRRNNYEVLNITDISFAADEIIFHCEDIVFSLQLANMPPLNVLRAQVRHYKKQGEFCLGMGDDANLVTLISKNNNQAASTPQLSDDQLFSLFDDAPQAAGATKAKKSKKKSNSNKKKTADADLSLSSNSMLSETDSGEFVEDVKVKKSGKKNKKAKSEKESKASYLVVEASLNNAKPNEKIKDEQILPSTSANAAAESPQAKDESFERAFKLLQQSSITDLDLEKIITAVQEKLGFKVDAEIHGNDMQVSLGESKMLFAIGEDFAGPQKLQQDLATLPTAFLKATGAGSFASLVYNADGKVIAVAPAAALLNYFDLPTIGVKKGKLAKAIERLETAFLNGVQAKLKVMASLDGTTLSLTKDSMENHHVAVSCNLRAISPEQLWPELLNMHAALLQQPYGGNMALCKIVLDEENKIIAIDRCDHLFGLNTSLQRVEIQDKSLFEACEEFFKTFDSASFNFFKNLAVKEVEFILKIMQHADSSLMVYGHPVVEYRYGDLLRSLGVEKQPLQQLVVRLDSLSDIDDLRGILTSIEVGAIIKGVKPEAMYCNYQGVRVTVCLGHNYMMQSIFNGDHFCSELEKGTLAYSEPQTNPVEVVPTVLPSQKTGNEIFMDNSYALKAALSWHKIMGKLGGGLRQLLQNLGFVSVITAPELESVTWQKAVVSKELLPGAVNYLQVVLHLESEEDAAQVLQEVSEMLQGVGY